MTVFILVLLPRDTDHRRKRGNAPNDAALNHMIRAHSSNAEA
jgi:hypothetical protein